MEEKEYHVAFGEELRDRREFVGPDLDAALVDRVLPLRLPELVGPPERVVRGEDGGRKLRQRRLERLARLRGKLHREHGIVRPEDLGQHLRCPAPGRLPRILTPLPREFLALGKRDGHTRLRLDQKLVLGQEPGEQHPVPVLVGRLVRQAIDLLLTGPAVGPVPELPAVSAQTAPQFPLRVGHARIRLGVAHREHGQRFAGALFARPPGTLDRPRELVAQTGLEMCAHGHTP